MSRFQIYALGMVLILVELNHFAFSLDSALAELVVSPVSLSPGDQYRLVFTTSTTRDALSSNIADYNQMVQNAADAVPQLQALGATWRAIASTPTVNAIANTATSPTDPSVPIFLIIDDTLDPETMIAANNVVLWSTGVLSPTLLSPIDNTETGLPSQQFVQTGTLSNGSGATTLELGSTPSVMIGVTNTQDSQWIQGRVAGSAIDRPVYGISSVLTAVPEPSSAWMVGVIVCVAAVWQISNRYLMVRFFS